MLEDGKKDYGQGLVCGIQLLASYFDCDGPLVKLCLSVFFIGSQRR